MVDAKSVLEKTRGMSASEKQRYFLRFARLKRKEAQRKQEQKKASSEKTKKFIRTTKKKIRNVRRKKETQTYTQEAAESKELNELEQAHETVTELKQTKSKMLEDPDKKYVVVGNQPLTNIGGPTITASGSMIVERVIDPTIEKAEEYRTHKSEIYKRISNLHPSAKVIYSSDGMSIKRNVIAEARDEWKTLSPVQQFAKSFYVGVTQFPTTVIHYVTGGKTKNLQNQLIRNEAKTWNQAKKVHEGDWMPFVSSTAFSPAMTHVVLPAAIGAGVGVGVGAAKAVSALSGRVIELGIIGYGGYETTKNIISSKNVSKTVASLVFTLPFAAIGYKSGHTYGYGRAEAYLYAHRTFKPGSSEMIRFKSALKLGRKLQHVKSLKRKPIDFAKDVQRMTPEAAQRTINYLSKNPNSVIGGSAASKTQIIGARIPRDIDILVKNVSKAKQFFGKLVRTSKGEHRIDIHGFDFGGKPGVYHRFGFQTLRSIRIGRWKYLRGGEQVFRKGIASVLKETKYRWFKDKPDFITHVQSQIFSARKSLNPITRLKGITAEKYLKLFKDPYASKSYGKITARHKLAKILNRKFKGYSPQTNIKSSGYISYHYPKYLYPTSYYIPIKKLPFYPKYYVGPSVKINTFVPFIYKKISSFKPYRKTSFYKPKDIPISKNNIIKKETYKVKTSTPSTVPPFTPDYDYPSYPKPNYPSPKPPSYTVQPPPIIGYKNIKPKSGYFEVVIKDDSKKRKKQSFNELGYLPKKQFRMKKTFDPFKAMMEGF